MKNRWRLNFHLVVIPIRQTLLPPPLHQTPLSSPTHTHTPQFLFTRREAQRSIFDSFPFLGLPVDVPCPGLLSVGDDRTHAHSQSPCRLCPSCQASVSAGLPLPPPPDAQSVASPLDIYAPVHTKRNDISKQHAQPNKGRAAAQAEN